MWKLTVGYDTRSDKSDYMWTRKCTRYTRTSGVWRMHKVCMEEHLAQVAIEGPILLFIYFSIKHPHLCNQVTSQLLILLECSKSQLANQAPQ
jgi:hypothetical protein